jgi:hypothetical protein
MLSTSFADGIPETAQARRLGHRLDNRIVETYSHVAPEVEQRLIQALQRRWHTARAAINPALPPAPPPASPVARLPEPDPHRDHGGKWTPNRPHDPVVSTSIRLNSTTQINNDRAVDRQRDRTTRSILQKSSTQTF